jgi:hypothetical protein
MNSTPQLHSVLERLPLLSNLETVFKIPAFISTSQGSATFKQWEEAFKTHKLAKRWVPIAIIAVIILGLITRLLFSHFLLFLFITLGLYITLRVLKSSLDKKENGYIGGRVGYAKEIAKTITQAIGGYYYIFWDGQMFFYNDQLCIYADAGNGGLTGYNKASIKKVNIEHVHLGSTTVSKSNTTGIGFNRGSFNSNGYDSGRYRGTSTNFSSTTTTANTQTHYEWKLDILTNFLEEPHITIVFPDTKDGEDTAKRACALLS